MSTLTKIDIMIWYQCLEIILFCIISIILIMVIKREEKEFKEVFRKL